MSDPVAVMAEHDLVAVASGIRDCACGERSTSDDARLEHLGAVAQEAMGASGPRPWQVRSAERMAEKRRAERGRLDCPSNRIDELLLYGLGDRVVARRLFVTVGAVRSRRARLEEYGVLDAPMEPAIDPARQMEIAMAALAASGEAA